MTALWWVAQGVSVLAGALAVAWPVGRYMARVFAGEPTGLHRVLAPVERAIYRLAGVRPDEEMPWQRYARAVVAFGAVSTLMLYGLQRLQGHLPLNPHGWGGVRPELAFNTAASFASNTNWQAYAGERTLSYLTQMAGLTVQNFVSAATGLAVAIAFIRGLVRRESASVGNFWVDLTRGTLYVLLPLAFILAIALVSQGVVQTLAGPVQARLLDPVRDGAGRLVDVQVIPRGPVASQEAIKLLGTNGGGYFGANSAHPFENPTPLSNWLEMVAMLAIPLALPVAFAELVGDRRQGLTLLAVMLFWLALAMAALAAAELRGNPLLQAAGGAGAGSGQPAGSAGWVQPSGSAGSVQLAGNLEGKEVRFGPVGSALFSAITTGTSTGAVNASHDSYTPLGGLVALWLMQLGEIAPGGVGSGLYGMLVFVLIAVFVAGLMVGRTPAYLGKKIEPYEMKMAVLYLLLMPLLVLSATAAAVVVPAGRSGITHPGPHGLSQVLYAFTSAANNNGSAFAGLGADLPFYAVATGLVMLAGRFWMMVPVLAMAGSLARKKASPVTAGTLPTHGPLFALWLVAVIALAGALNFLPALALGPVVEHLLMVRGSSF